MNPLFKQISLGRHILKNRIAMAPLTRRRAGSEQIANDLMALYYMQRASAGIIIAEGSQISPQGVGYPATPGIHTKEQVEGWKKVTSAVHGKGGVVFLQLWHVGRISHPLLQPDHKLPVAPSAVKAPGMLSTPQGKMEMVTPRALLAEEIPGIVDDFRNAAINAIEAGFDGVEIHGANGYLPDQFLKSSVNLRTDHYGGGVQNRSRFLLEVVEAVAGAVGSDRTGVRLSPSGVKYGDTDPDPVGLYSYVINALNDYGLAYLHLVEPQDPLDDHPQYLREVTPYFRKIYNGVLMTCGGYNRSKAMEVVDSGHADVVAFGKLYISNPDLPERLQLNAPLNDYDKDTFYTPGPAGYTDYPFLGKEDHT